MGDVVVENVNEGTDTVQSSVTYALAANIENLTLVGAAAINGTGNTLNNVLIGNTGNNTLDGGLGADTMSGGLGDDIYVVDNSIDVVNENAGEGTDTVQSSIVSILLSANVENLALTGTAAINGTGNALGNVLTGNSGMNTLSGLDGNDTLNGGGGLDTLIGGKGDDTYIVDNTGVIMTEKVNEGIDTVQSSITYTLGTYLENLTLTGNSAINGMGNSVANVLIGNSGNNTLSGGAGADTLIGGLGDDSYVVENINDIVVENANGGTDLVNASVTYTLSANVEKLILLGTAAINGTGNDLNNVLTGNTAVNTLAGGKGNDTYVIDAGDVILENVGEGIDTVQSLLTYSLASVSNVENLTLTGAAASNGTGNALDNVIIGNNAVNTLMGGIGNDTLNGGTGADSLLGGIGNDIYVVDNVGDIVTENASEGADTVQSSITYALGANVENLILTGTTALKGTGNALDNVLTGNSGANTLTGGSGNDTLDGGVGADKLLGGMGDDIYAVESVGDVVTEIANEGTDTVQSSITYTLGANVENLTLSGLVAINGTGNALNNLLIGNSGNNALAGGAGNDTLQGGLGNDSLDGGVGNDTYTFGLGWGNDTLTDYETAANNDLVSFGTGIASSAMTFKRVGNDLVCTGTGGTDSLTIKNWYLDSAYQVEQFGFADGTILNASQINAMASPMAIQASGLVASARVVPAAATTSTSPAFLPQQQVAQAINLGSGLAAPRQQTAAPDVVLG